jgi:hypothetical protein
MPKYKPRGPRGPLAQGRNGTRSLNAILAGGGPTTGAGDAAAAPVNAVAASRLLTVTGVFSNGETVVIGGLTYTFQTVLTNVARNVLIGASAAVSLDNLKSAVNGTAGGGTTYAAATVAHPAVEATTNTDTTQLFVARVKGADGNALDCTETCANASFPSATFTGGVDGTPAEPGESRFYNGHMYYAHEGNTISSANWLKSAQFTAP